VICTRPVAGWTSTRKIKVPSLKQNCPAVKGAPVAVNSAGVEAKDPVMVIPAGRSASFINVLSLDFRIVYFELGAVV